MTAGPPPDPPETFGWAPPDPPSEEEPDPPRRRSRAMLVVASLSAVLVLAVAIAVPLVLDAFEEPVDTTLAAVEAYDDLPTTHVDDGVDYDQSPPVGGKHNPAWLDCGVYDAPVPDENAVHDLEHGTVWITHDPDLDADEVDQLAAVLPQNGILSPYDGLRAPVVVTVWERQLALTGPDDPRLELFLATFGGGETAPEPFASCAGGLQLDDGGRAI